VPVASLIAPQLLQISDVLGNVSGGFHLSGNLDELGLSDLKATSSGTDLWSLNVTGSIKNVLNFSDVVLSIVADVPSGADLLSALNLEPIKTGPVKPAALNGGTVVELRDLFYATPARLKFMKTDRAEANAITDMVKRMILGRPQIHFSLTGSDRQPLEYRALSGNDALLQRIEQVIGKEFSANAMTIDAQREGVRLTGYAALPTYNRGNGQHQFVYVNGRPVQDKQLTGAVRGAYADFLARYRHAVLALFIEIDPALVDVNVHPAKAEVRFRDPSAVRGLIVGALRQVLEEAGHSASAALGAHAFAQFGAGNGGGGFSSLGGLGGLRTDAEIGRAHV